METFQIPRKKIVSFTFPMGVISGIIMGSQFGKTWPGFMENRLQPRQAIVGL